MPIKELSKEKIFFNRFGLFTTHDTMQYADIILSRYHLCSRFIYTMA